MRDNTYLQTRLEEIIRVYFSDLTKHNPLEIKFSRRNKRTMGSIRYYPQKKITIIRINAYLQEIRFPEFLINAVISHELCHFIHGFSSSSKPQYSHPHRGGVVAKELAQRGLGRLEKKFKEWMKKNWLAELKKKNCF